MKNIGLKIIATSILVAIASFWVAAYLNKVLPEWTREPLAGTEIAIVLCCAVGIAMGLGILMEDIA